MLGGGLAGSCVCLFGSPLFLWLGVEVILSTITKCIWDPSPSSRGGNGPCPHALAFSASVDYKTYKQQQVGKGFSLFSSFRWWGARQKGTSALESFQSRKIPPRGRGALSQVSVAQVSWPHSCFSCEGDYILPTGKG